MGAYASPHSWRQQGDQGETFHYFSALCQLRGIFIRTIHGRLRSINPLQLVIRKPQQIYPKLYIFLESCCICLQVTSTKMFTSLSYLPIPFPPFISLILLPIESRQLSLLNPKAFQLLCHPAATRPPLTVMSPVCFKAIFVPLTHQQAPESHELAPEQNWVGGPIRTAHIEGRNLGEMGETRLLGRSWRTIMGNREEASLTKHL